MDERVRRMTENEALFREVNERVQDVAQSLESDSLFEYFCECANADCTFHLELTRSQYESVRADPKQFVVLPNHFTPEVETLIGKEDGYWVVRKTGEPGAMVEELDPRSRSTREEVHRN